MIYLQIDNEGAQAAIDRQIGRNLNEANVQVNACTNEKQVRAWQDAAIRKEADAKPKVGAK